MRVAREEVVGAITRDGTAVVVGQHTERSGGPPSIGNRRRFVQGGRRGHDTEVGVQVPMVRIELLEIGGFVHDERVSRIEIGPRMG